MRNGTNHPESESTPESGSNAGLPEDLRGVCETLDALGARERSSAPSGIEDRVFGASVSALREQRPAVIGRIGSGASAWKFRLAAAIGIAAIGVGAAYVMVSRPAVVTTPTLTASESSAIRSQLDSDLQQWMSEAQATSDELASVRSALGTIGHGSTDPWEAVEWNAEDSSL